jgi:hypothetical protein
MRIHPQAEHALPDERERAAVRRRSHGVGNRRLIREQARGAASLEARTDLLQSRSMRRTPATSSPF